MELSLNTRFSFYRILLVFTTILIVLSCKQNPDNKSENMPIVKEKYGTLPTGEEIALYTLKNSNGMIVKAIEYGGIITSIEVPDKNQNFENVVLNLPNLEKYMASNPFFGSLVGRYGNRIARGQFTIGQKTYHLAKNNEPNHLHGGEIGFDKVKWETSHHDDTDIIIIRFSYLSPDGEEGYPGNLKTTVEYALHKKENLLEVRYYATTDQPTHVNLTQHSYFNLSGNASESILDHQLMINASNYLPVDQGLIPLGHLEEVQGTPFEFRSLKPIGMDIDSDNPQIQIGGGYDHCWVIDRQS